MAEPAILTAAYVQADGYGADSPLGWLERIYIQRYDGQRMTWSEVHAVFADRYPDRWALQWFPPEDRLVDEVNRYHLWVLPEGSSAPGGMDIGRCRDFWQGQGTPPR